MKGAAVCLLVLAAPAALRAQPVPDPQAPAPRPAADEAISPPAPLGDPILAEYPQAASGAARVVVQIDVDAAGNVSAAEVVGPSQPGFDDAALAAARRLRFSPARRGDAPIPVRIQY